MKKGIFSLGVTVFLSLAAHTATAHSATTHAVKANGGFAGADPQPIGKTAEAVSQLRIRFPSTMIKKDAFKVSCAPAIEGYSSWADNNTLWTYNFKAKAEGDTARLAGGTHCDILQTDDLVSASGTKWANGTIKYDITIDGPNVADVLTGKGFRGLLREKDPVLLILFDGPVDRQKFFSEASGYLSYQSSSAPGEKLPLIVVPPADEAEIFEHFKNANYLDLDFKDRTWILATVKQSLIPGSKMTLTIQKQAAADNSTGRAANKYTQDMTVRSQFEAEITCATPSAKGANCMPHAPISVQFNGKVKWPDVKDSYIEYIPFKSTDGKMVRSYPELQKDEGKGFLNTMINMVGKYVPYVAKFSDTLVDSITFDVNIEPQTQAKVVVPQTLTDIDGRKLSNAIAEFHIRIGSFSEAIKVPQTISFFEKNVPNLYLPVGIVNLNQQISIRKSSTDKKSWAPIRDITAMIQIIRAYQERGDFRDAPNYVSPLEHLNVATTKQDIKLTGMKNRATYLQFPFGAGPQGDVSGFYALEVSSPTYEAIHSDIKDKQYLNPPYVLAQVTDLAVHLKKGTQRTLAWVTKLSDAQPVAGAQVEVYNCLGQAVLKVQTDASGLVSFPNQKWATSCQSRESYGYFAPDEFYVAAHLGTDVALTHSTWTSAANYAVFGSDMDSFYGDVTDNQAYFHAVVGVNLVKPGQKVPVELVAKLPDGKGFSEVTKNQLPAKARIVNADDEKTYYEFPITWKNGVAEFEWVVPADSSVKIGRYSIVLTERKAGDSVYVSSGDIEVAEFKVPLMSGIISFPNQPLVQPDSIPVSSVIRYANGVGAKSLNVDLSYYFEPTTVDSKELPGFSFGSGPVTLTDDNGNGRSDLLPSSTRPATISGLTTATDGSLGRDLATETVSNGQTTAQVLKTLIRPQDLVVRVRYQDQMGEFQTLSQGKVIYNSNLYVGTKLVPGTRTDARLLAAVIDASGKVVTSLPDLELKIVRVESKVIGEELFGGLIKNTIERELKDVRWSGGCAMQNNVVACAVGALKEGTYAFQVTSASSKQVGNTLFKVDTDGRVYNDGDYYQFGDGEPQKQLPLALNKKSYKNGEKAIVSFPAPFKSCRALVSVERSDVMQAFVVSDACTKGYVEVPVDAVEAPNAYIAVYAITGRAPTSALKLGDKDLGRPTYRLGFANMRVNWGHFKSNVQVSTDKPKYAPGETVNVDVKVQAEEGALAGGTVTLVAIEEKILELKANTTYNILEALMQSRSHDVQTITPLERVETVTASNTDIPGEDQRKGGNEGGDGSSKSEFKRKLFDALVAFQPGVAVVNGVAKFSFKTNDSLTKFKIFVIATDSSQKFGSGTAGYLTEKDTQSYSNIPSVAHTGDSFPVKVTVQNNSGKAAQYRAEVTVTVRDASGKIIDTRKLSKVVNIGNASSSAVDVGRLAISDDASRVEYSVRVYDANGNLVDAMDPPAQTILASVPLAVHDSFIVQVDKGTLAQPLTKETDALAGKGELQVSLSKSLVSSSLEQINRRMEHNIFASFFIESRVFQALLNSSSAQPDVLKKVLESLLGYTDTNGFIKFSVDSKRGSVWLTASIINLLQQEPWAMKLLPPALTDKLKGAVSQVLTKSVDPDYLGLNKMDWLNAEAVMGRAAFAFGDTALQDSARALSTTVAAELQRDPKAYGIPMLKWENADLVDYWLLQVFTAPKSAIGSAAYKEMISPARLNYTGNMAQLSGNPHYNSYYTDETIETAKLLFGHARLKADKNLARALAVGLVNASYKGWYTVGTMMGVSEGLKNFGRSYEAEVVTGSAIIAIPEQSQTQAVNWDSTAVAKLSTPWTDSKATIQITQSGQGKPWMGVQALTAVPLTAARGQGLAVDKQVRNVTRGSGYQIGDVIEVTLNVNASALMNHVAMNDPIPAGSNILGDGYGDFNSGEKSYSGYKFYFESLPMGVTTVKYQYQLNNPGTFKLPPTRAEGLYLPGVFGETPNAAITVD